MSQLSWMITITDRKKAPDFVALYQHQNIHVSLTTVGAGTAVSETLNYLGWSATEKAVFYHRYRFPLESGKAAAGAHDEH